MSRTKKAHEQYRTDQRTNKDDPAVVEEVSPELKRLLEEEREDEPALENIFAMTDVLSTLSDVSMTKEAPKPPQDFTDADMLRHLLASAAPEPLEQKKMIEDLQKQLAEKG